MDINSYTVREKRWFELCIGIVSLLAGSALVLAFAFSVYRLWQRQLDTPTLVLLAAILFMGLLLLSAGLRLVFSRARSDGGLLSPFVLCIGGCIFLFTPIIALFQYDEPQIGTFAILLPGLACFVLARRRWSAGKSRV